MQGAGFFRLYARGMKAPVVLVVILVAVSAADVSAASATVGDPMLCDSSKVKVLGSLLLGHRFDALARTRVGRAGVAGLDRAASFAGSVSDAIGRRLMPAEQRQAAAATHIAVCKGRPGQKVDWVSAARPGIRGSALVTAASDDRALGHCITIADVVLRKGEETRVVQRMCRAPGARGYVAAS